MLNAFYDWFIDRFLRAEGDLEQTRKVVAVQSAKRGITPTQVVWDLLDVIDTKASALLIHISLMATVVGLILAGVADTGPESLTQKFS